MKVQSLLLGAALATVLTGAAFAAADKTAAADRPSCFFSRDWDSWHSPDENTIYLRVGVRDIYRIDLSSGSKLLTWPDSHIISKLWGSSSICRPIDLDLSVSDGNGFREFVIAKAITKLTPEQVAAIPKKDLP
jgi:hypothetical protein